MILLFGARGYIGSVFAKEMQARGIKYRWCHHAGPFSQGFMSGYDCVINCAAYIPQPSVSLCDQFPEETIDGNLIFPIRLAKLCRGHNCTLLHISTACLFDEARKYTEADAPLRGFGGHCGMYVGTKLLAEESVRQYPAHYVCRIRLPFDQFNNDRNYLSKLAKYPRVYDHLNSLSHRGDCVKAMLDLIETRSNFGTYHICNPGSISARDVVGMMRKKGLIDREPEWIPGPCTGCTLSVDKLLSTGVKIRPVEEAVADSIDNSTKL